MKKKKTKARPDLIRAAIRSALDHAGISEAELARRCDGAPSQPKINRYLAGKIDMRVSSAERMLVALGYAIDAHGQLWRTGLNPIPLAEL